MRVFCALFFLEICSKIFVSGNNYTHVRHVVAFSSSSIFFLFTFFFLEFPFKGLLLFKSLFLELTVPFDYMDCVIYATIYFGFIVVDRYVHDKIWVFFLFFCWAMRFFLLPSFSSHPILQNFPPPFLQLYYFLFVFLVFYIG